MENLLFFIVGGLLTLIFTKKPFQITIEHIHNYVKEQEPLIDMEALEEQMLKKDPAKDQEYQDLEEMNTVLQEVKELMGGSDR